jgi:ubiquinone/menaquinone biosynthesis C-methylase UbiE
VPSIEYWTACAGNTEGMNLIFDGPLGLVTGRIMAKKNAPAELEAIEELAPGPADSVLLIGFGPGAAISALLPRLPDGRIGGADPSWAMNLLARRHARDPRVRLERATAARLPWPDDYFDGATAVNSVMLWKPLAASAAEVARVLRPGARLVTVTHDWALRDPAPTEHALAANGFTDVMTRSGRSEEGRTTMLVGTAR